METTLLQKYSPDETKIFLEPFKAIAHDVDFWNHTLDGLAVLGGPGIFRALRIPQSVAEYAVVTNSFDIKPLRRFLQSADRYQVLGLSLDKIRLFEGNRYALDEVELVSDVPLTIQEALGEELTEPHQTVASYGGVGGQSNRMHHSQGGKAVETDIDAERFFRAVDRAVFEYYTKPSGLPLILAALPEHHHRFHRVSQNPLLIDEGIRHNPDSLTSNVLRELAWQAIEPRYQAQLASLCDKFEQARSKSLGSDNLVEVAKACSSGRVETLLLDASRQIAGKLDSSTGSIDLNTPEPHTDILDNLCELVSNKGGTAVVIPTELMPSRTGLAAMYRY